MVDVEQMYPRENRSTATSSNIAVQILNIHDVYMHVYLDKLKNKNVLNKTKIFKPILSTISTKFLFKNGYFFLESFTLESFMKLRFLPTGTLL